MLSAWEESSKPDMNADSTFHQFNLMKLTERTSIQAIEVIFHANAKTRSSAHVENSVLQKGYHDSFTVTKMFLLSMFGEMDIPITLYTIWVLALLSGKLVGRSF